MKLLADTHILLWAIAKPESLSERARRLLESRENVVYYSLASVWEVAIKHAINPSNMPVSEERLVELCERTGFSQLPLRTEHIYGVKLLTRPDGAPSHKDLFDRLLIAQAKAEGLTFLTSDRLLPFYGEDYIELC